MKIGIDVSMIDITKAGIGYYAYSLLNSLIEVDQENQYYLFTYNKVLLSDISLPDNFKVIEIGGSGNLKWMVKCLPAIYKLKLDQFLSVSNLFWGCVLNNCTTVVHDISQILHPEFFYKKGNLFYKIELNILLRRKGIVVTPSYAVKEELKMSFSGVRSKVSVIAEGLHKWTFTESTDEFKTQIKAKYNLPSQYILTVGTLEPRKNLLNVIKGFKSFKHSYNTDHKLVIVGKKGWFYEQIFNLVAEEELEESVKFLGYVPENDLPAVYDLSEYVISLSYYEGFGLPLIEANAREKIVLASDIPVYRELNVSGIFINPHSDPRVIGENMNTALSYKFNRKPDFFDTYSWNSAANQFLQLWH